MTIFDYGFLLILVVSVVISVMRGLVREVFSLLSWIGAFIVAKYGSPLVAGWLSGLISHPQIRLGSSFVLVMVASVLLFSFLSLQVVKMVKMTGLSGTDRALGAFFGLARGVLVAIVLVLLAGLTPLPQERFWREAFFRYPLEAMAAWMQPRLPAQVTERLNP
ncbi:MAG: CvpA family protein [Betaproteobacteria bacterium]|jgi:membrane protein required for colicin V production|nr:MAG: CvpA family protein [Betaproteobacteria bacterium]